MSRSVLFLFILIFVFLIRAHAQQNPFLPSSKAASAKDTVIKKHTQVTVNQYRKKIPFLRPLIRYQKKLSQSLTVLLRKIKEDFSVVYLSILFMTAFFYGIVHALGPGHAKVIIGSYMLTNNHTLRHSFYAGSIFAATHVGMALLIFSLFTLVFHVTHTDTNSISTLLYNVSGIMIMLIGIVLLVQVFIDNGNGHGRLSRFFKTNSLPAISAVAGLMPCPGALLILIFSKCVGITVYGVIAVLFLSLGMALTVSVAGTIGVMANKAVRFSVRGKEVQIIVKSVRIFGSILIIGIGLLMTLY